MAAPLIEPVSQLFSEFQPWFNQIVDQSQPDLIVAIARGAARLLELYSDETPIPLVSQHAIPFMQDTEISDQRVLIFDDSIIFGSTMAEVAAYIQTRGATVSNAAYVGDQAIRDIGNPNLAQLSPLVIGKALNQEQVRMHHAALVHEIYQEGLDLNLDFPTLKVSIGSYSKFDIPFISELLSRTSLFGELRNVTHPVVGYNGVERWTATSEVELCLKLSDERIARRPKSKTRVTFSADSGEILFTPIVQLGLHQSIEFSEVEFGSPEVNAAWKALQFSVHEEDPYYASSLLRLVSFFEATIQCRRIAEHARRILTREFEEYSVVFVEREPDVVLGRKLSTSMCAFFESLDAEGLQITSFSGSSSVVSNLGESELAKNLVRFLKANQVLRLLETDSCPTLLAKTFKGLREITDSDDIRKACGNSSRLKNGLSFEDILFTIKKSGITQSEEEISLALDYCIDRALVVPKNLEREGWVQRLFYCGEDGDNDPDEQLKQKLYDATTELKSGLEISKFDFQKICATTKHVLDFVPLQTTPNNFGMTCVVGENDLVDWVTPKVNAPFSFIKNKQDNWVLCANEDYTPVLSNTWTPEQIKAFFETYKNLHKVFGKISNNGKLLLSTCGTIERSFDAIAFEIHSWSGTFSHREPKKKSFGDGVHGATTDLKSQANSTAQDAVDRLYWSIVFAEESQKKLKVWRERRSIRLQVENSIDRMNKPEIRRWWDSAFKALIATESVSESYSRGLSALADLADQMRNLTACAIRTLVKAGVLTKDRIFDKYSSGGLIDKKADLNFYLNGSPKSLESKFNSLSNSLSSHWGTIRFPSLVIPPIPQDVAEMRDWAIQILDQIQSCRRVILKNIDEVAPEIDTKTYARRFSPGLDREISVNGNRVFRLRKEVYVLTGKRDTDLDIKESECLKELLSSTAESNDQIFVDIGAAGNVFTAYSGYPINIASISNAVQGLSLGIALVVQLGTVRSKMPIDQRVGTVELAPNLIQKAHDILGRLDTILLDAPNTIASDEHVWSKLEKHLERSSEMVKYDHDSGSLCILKESVGEEPSEKSPLHSQNETAEPPDWGNEL